MEFKIHSSQPLGELLSVSLTMPGKIKTKPKQEQKQAKEPLAQRGRRCISGIFYASVSVGAGKGEGRARELTCPPVPTCPHLPYSRPPRRPALTWCLLPGRPAAGTLLFSGPGRAVRLGARRRARRAASSPRSGDAGGAVTMETAEAAEAAAAQEAAFRPAPGGGQSVATDPASSKPDLRGQRSDPKISKE